MKRKLLLTAVICLMAVLAGAAGARADQKLVAQKAAAARGIVTRDRVSGIDVTLKAVYTEKEIFFLVRFPDPDESRQHKPWVWDKQSKRYEPGPQREDTFVFKWSLDPDCRGLSVYAEKPYSADIWFWKACRTDPAGYADDKIQHLSIAPHANSKPVVSRYEIAGRDRDPRLSQPLYGCGNTSEALFLSFIR